MQDVGYTQKNKRKKNKILIMLVLLIASLIFGAILHTQLLASSFGYDPNLGHPVKGHIYYPWQGVLWHVKYSQTYPAIFQQKLELATYGSLGFCLLALLITVAYNPVTKGNKTLYGTARFAKEKDIKETGLLDPIINPATKQSYPNAVVVGGWQKNKTIHYLYHRGDEHVLAFAPSRSGKGVSLVLPTLYTWLESAVILDIKGEAWALTAGWRKNYAGNKVLRFEPTDTDGNGTTFNPFEEIRIGTIHEVADAERLAKSIINPNELQKDDHWDETAEALLQGSILYLLYDHKAEGLSTPSLYHLAKLLSDPSREDSLELFEMMKEKDYHELSTNAAQAMINKPERERGSVISTAERRLRVYYDPILRKNISKSTFRISDIMNNEDPASLYLVIRPSDKERVMPFIKVLISMISNHYTKEMDYENGRAINKNKYKMLFLLDEFTSLGQMTAIEERVPFYAGFGIKCFIIVQDIKQLHRYYKREENIVQNCHVRISFAANDEQTAAILSRLTGETTVVKKQTTASGSRMSTMLGKVSTSFVETKRPLLTPDEIMRLPIAVKDKKGNILEPGKMLIFVSGHHAIMGTQSLFFRDDIFLKRSQVEAPLVSDVLI